jgi:hypothetical protein
MGWLFWQELWPSWRPGEPPPFHIDLVEEVQQTTNPRTHWTVLRQRSGEQKAFEIFHATTLVDYMKSDDTFLLQAEFTTRKEPLSNTQPYFVAGFQVVSMSSQYRVDRAGELRSLRAEIRVSPRKGMEKMLAIMGQEELEPSLHLWGEVRGDQLFTHCRSSLVPANKPFDLLPARVSHNGSVIMPLHPVNRIHGLRPGQSWRQPMIDPLRDAFAVLPGISAGVSYVNARVLPELQVLKMGPKSVTNCLVIEYEADGKIIGSTWVEEGSERVQRQEANLEGDRWIMQCDLRNRNGSAR